MCLDYRFFGSGKSHFLKILGYLLSNEQVGNKKAIDYFDDKISDSIVMGYVKQSVQINNKVILFNIDSKAKSNSKQQSGAIMDIMLRSFNEAVGLCGTTPWVADLERILIKDNQYEEFKETFKQFSNKDWLDGRNQALLNRDNIVKALVNVKGISEDSAQQYVDDAIMNFTKTTEEFAKIITDYTIENNTRVIFLMDEVGQFIGTNGKLMLNLQTVVEDLGKFCKGNAWVVVTSQQELKEMVDANKGTQNDFSKIQGRFDTRISLSGSNADEVIKKRILEKTENAVIPLKGLYEQYESKLNNLIIFDGKPTWTGFKSADEFKDVYPFASYQFELLQKVFEAIRVHGMTEGKHLSQHERSLLSAFQESAKEIADDDVGILVPFDSFYSTVKNFIDYPIQTVFTNAERNPSLESFDLKVLKLLFMIKHVKEMPATIDRLSTLMVSNLSEDKLVLKEKISNSLKKLEEETLIQKNGPEYDFLTNEEQDVNRQISNTSYNEGEITRIISEIIYEKILDSNKYRYKSRYDFSLNRYVDDEIKGSYNPDNITIKIVSQFNVQGLEDESEFLSESMRVNGIVINLKEGAYLEELIKAAKIENFRRNNSSSASSTLAEIMDKKAREASERRKRAEEIIKEMLKKAKIYANSSVLDIREKEGKDRIHEAIEHQIKSKYYKLGYVQEFYNTNDSINVMLNDVREGFDVFDQEKNYTAYKEILEKIKDLKEMNRGRSVKQLIDIFAKAPYGWREIDVRGMIGYLLKLNKVKISIHNNVVALNNQNFKYKFSKGENLDTMVVSIQEKTDDEILNEVKRIMKDAFDETFSIQEEQLKNDVLDFFNIQINKLRDIQAKYGPESYPGRSNLASIYKMFETIIKTNDNQVIFNNIINNKDFLIENAPILEQIIMFYQTNSAQMQNYKDAKEIYNWYQKNQIFEDLSDLDDVILKIHEILNLELPFSKMSELGQFVFQAKSIQNKIHEEKNEKITKALNQNLMEIEHEVNQALLTDLNEVDKLTIKSKFEEVKDSFKQLFNRLNHANQNELDSVKATSDREVEEMKKYIAKIIFNTSQHLPENEKPIVKRVMLGELISVANKRIKTEDDIKKVLKEIEKNLKEILSNTDEIKVE